MGKIIDLFKKSIDKNKSMNETTLPETYKSYPIILEIVNLAEVLKFMSPIVDINHSPFEYSWFPHKEEEIQESLKFIEKNFMEKYLNKNPGKEISSSSIKKECRILKIYDQEFGQDDSMLIYEYELYDSENKPIMVQYTVTIGYGTLHEYLYIREIENIDDKKFD